MSGRWLVVLGVVAVVLVFVLPPVGLGLGILTIVLAGRAMRATKPQDQELLTPDGAPVTVKVAQPGRINAVFALTMGIAATVLGAIVIVVLFAFWGEFSDYAKCRENSNTTQGSQKCEDAFRDAVTDRLGQ